MLLGEDGKDKAGGAEFAVLQGGFGGKRILQIILAEDTRGKQAAQMHRAIGAFYPA